MARRYLFADEAGNRDFRRGGGASDYFILGTITLDELEVGNRLLELRRELAWQGIALESTFHASEDQQFVRDEVFRALADTPFRYDATILEKCKTAPHLQRDEDRFYKMAWFLHFKYVGPKIVGSQDELLVIAASLGTKKRRRAMRLAIADVVEQGISWCSKWEVAFWPAESDPCLQVADYCTWAVQRKYERGDDRSYKLIEDRIATEFQPFAFGTTKYY